MKIKINAKDFRVRPREKWPYQNSISPATYRRSITSWVNEAISPASNPENKEMPGRTAGLGGHACSLIDSRVRFSVACDCFALLRFVEQVDRQVRR